MSVVLGKSELDQLAADLSAVEDWLRDQCTARHHEDMADVVHRGWQVVDDLYDDAPG